MIETERIVIHNQETDRKGDYVLYWMQASQRVKYNHALDYAILEAKKRNKPVVVCFGLTPDFPSANLRHYVFMLQGLQEVARELEKKGIYFAFRLQLPSQTAIDLSHEAGLLVMDRGDLSIQRRWRSDVIKEVSCTVAEVETNVIVPVEAAAEKEQYSAATLRPRLHKALPRFISSTPETARYRQVYYAPAASSDRDIPARDIADAWKQISVDRSVAASERFIGGTVQAEKLLDTFINENIAQYSEWRNNPNWQGTSKLSPYLHFGQISPLHIYLEIMNKAPRYAETFIEELVVRRELAYNFVHYNSRYDNMNCLPDWCRKTLKDHASDKREHLYSCEEFENGKTHDMYWNAAQWEMVYTGKMQGYMRMYWGKKILEWTKSPEEAYRIMIYLNDKYEVDGRDPNGYAGVAWCFGKHDRAWKERPVFGKIRYMNDRGLKRKFPDIDDYVANMKTAKREYNPE